MTIYNISQMTNSGNIAGIAVAANTYSNGILFGFGSIAFFLVILLSLKRNNDFDECLLVSSFISFFIAGFLTYGGFLNIIFPLAYIVMVAFTAFYMWVAGRNTF